MCLVVIISAWASINPNHLFYLSTKMLVLVIYSSSTHINKCLCVYVCTWKCIYLWVCPYINTDGYFSK